MLPSSSVSDGPYRATKLWNEVVRLFRSGMPVKRHWHQLRAVHDSFTGAEAVDWLHDCLKHNTNFGPQVTREQTIRLLSKFLKNHVVEDISGRWGSEEFNEGKQLYRFPVGLSPSKAIRQPLALLSSNVISPRQQSIADAKNRFLLQSKMKQTNQVEQQLTTAVSSWQKAYMSSLRSILHLKTIEEVLPCGILHTEWLYHNATKDDLSTFTEHGMPYWVISAMQCLANWPNSEGSGLPNYPGFERDIFAAVCGYFQALSEPLVTFNLYKLFVTIFVRAENVDHLEAKSHQAGSRAASLSPVSDCEGDPEVEKLRRKLMQAQMRHTNKAIRHRKSLRHGSIPPKYLGCGEDPACSTSLPRWRWKLEDVASRDAWNERFTSFQKLDELTEESTAQNESKFENYASLPELRFSTLPRSASKAANLMSAKSKDGRLYEYKDPENATTTNLDEGKSPSVENLLLDMSYRMSNEMEDALMNSKVCKSPIGAAHGNESDEVYERVTLQEDRSDTSSPAYRTMKPLFEKHHQTTRNDRYLKSGAIKKCDTLKTRKNLSVLEPNLSKENVYMEISASQPNISVTAKPFHPTLNAFAETQTLRRTLKPSKEDLENDLMFSPIHKPSFHEKRNFAERKIPEKTSNYWKEPLRSDIVGRREVPPPCAKQEKKFDYEFVQRRLPYVSQPIVPNSAAASQPSLSRSHSTLSHRPPKEFLRGDGSRQSRAPRPHSFGQRFAWSNKSLLPSAKSCNNFTEFSQPKDQPPSPLTAAFDSARTRMTTSAASTRVVESLQLCLLLLPPSSRSKLRLLLRLIVKMCDNPHLVDLHDILSTRAFILQELSPCIIRQSTVVKKSSNRQIEKRIVNVFMQHTAILMNKPAVLDKTAQEMMAKSKVTNGQETDHQRPLKRQATFCKQVTIQEYEKERRPVLEESLKQLLNDIVHDENMTMKEKRKKLKQFQKSYPGIYRECYPQGEPTFDNRRSNSRKKPMLSTALKRLRSLRS